jgi:putative hemolysin
LSEYWLEILLFFLGLIFSGFFSGSEAVLLSIPIDRTKQLISEGGAEARAFKFLASRSTEILTTILVGNNIVNIYVASLTTSIAHKQFQDDAIAISVGVTTAFILIFGEIIPKTFARSKAEALSVFVVRVLQSFYYLLWPIVKPLSFIIQNLLGENAQLQGRIITKDDIEFMVSQAEKEQSIDSKHLDLLSSILEFPKIKVKDIMIPRNNVIALRSGDHFDEIVSVIKDNGHSRYPVFQEDSDHILGFLHAKDLAFVSRDEIETFKVADCIKSPFFVYEHMKIQAVFDHMNRNKVHLSLVKDENGTFVGIITLEDIMEEIFGEIQDEHDQEDTLDTADNGSDTQSGLTISGTTPLRDLNNEYDIKIDPTDNYSTLNGFLLEILGNTFPNQGQVIVWDKYIFHLSHVVESQILDVTIRETKEKKKSNQIERADIIQTELETTAPEESGFPSVQGSKLKTEPQ